MLNLAKPLPQRAAESGEGGKHGENCARSASGDDEAEDDAASAVSWVTLEDTVAAESGAEGLLGDRKDYRPAACKGSQAERKLILKGKYAPGTSTTVRGTWWDKKGDDGPHGRDCLQTTYDKHFSCSAKQENVVMPLEEDAPKQPEPFTSSRQKSLPEPASVEGGAAGAATLTPTTVERSRSHPGSLARFLTRLTRGAFNAAPERYDVTERGAQEAARRGANTKRSRQNIRAGSR
ncbi:hypothetical protein MRX96_035897 [Rhipicephalus microplus]